MKRIVFTLTMFLCAINMIAHGSFIAHCEDMMEVFGFEYNIKLFSRNKDTKSNTSWTKFISSDMIDNTVFHRHIERKYSNFKIAQPKYHRLLFHWGYNAEPWSPYLESHFRTYCRLNYVDNEEALLMEFKAEVKAEQKRRNRKINETTEKVFGFAHGGVDAK